MTKHEERVQDILKQERQWPRHCRIMYANYRMGTAANKEEHKLWSDVLAANCEKPAASQVNH